jgi:hypothetical protein
VRPFKESLGNWNGIKLHLQSGHETARLMYAQPGHRKRLHLLSQWNHLLIHSLKEVSVDVPGVVITFPRAKWNSYLKSQWEIILCILLSRAKSEIWTESKLKQEKIQKR